MSNDIQLYSSIGKIVVNLQSLEFLLRLFLQNVQNPKAASRYAPYDFTNLTVGAWVPLDFLTSYDGLKELIQKVNSTLEARGLSERIDESIVQLRDAIAHGRVLGNEAEGPFHIFKFSKPNKSKTQVRVELSVEMTPEWLAAQVRHTYDETLKIMNAARQLGLECFPK